MPLSYFILFFLSCVVPVLVQNSRKSSALHIHVVIGMPELSFDGDGGNVSGSTVVTFSLFCFRLGRRNTRINVFSLLFFFVVSDKITVYGVFCRPSFTNVDRCIVLL